MTAPLLTTKLLVPPLRPHLVPRPRLLERLDQGLRLGARVTLVSAPAGYGKTTLIAGWLQHLQASQGTARAVGWLSLDEADSDPARFLSYLLAALQSADRGIGQSVQAMLQSPEPPPGEMLLSTLVNDIAASARRFVLVLDDYHCIKAIPIHQQLAFLVEHQPPQMHLVICTREDPPLPLSRLRARGQVTEVRQSDLQFTAEEAAEFLREAVRAELSTSDVAALHRRTEGWIAGLQLAALSIRSPENVRRVVESFAGTQRHILDYLLDEVFRQQSADMQDFLLQTAILDRLTAPLCDAVTEKPGSQQVLQSLERSNLFIIPLDESRSWYRYHHLFADLLRHRLQLARTDDVAPLHVRASAWYEQNGFPADAVQHALAAQDWERAGRLIHSATGDLLRRGEVATLLGWFAKLPPDIVRAQPLLCLDYGWPLLLAGQIDAAESLLDCVAQLASDQPDLLGQVAAAQVYLSRAKGDTRRSVEMAQKALSLLPETDLTTRGIVAMNLGLVYWHAGCMSEAERVLREAHHAALGSGNDYARVTSHFFLGRVHAVRGQLRQAADTCRALLTETGQYPILAGAHLDLCALHYEWDELEKAAEYLRQGMESAKRSGNAEFLLAAHLTQARLASTMGNRTAALEAVQACQELAQAGNLPVQTLSRIASCAVEAALAQGDVALAETWVRQTAQDADAHPFYRYLGLARARLLIAQGQNQAASKELQRCSETASRAGWGYGLIAVLVLQSLAAETSAAALEFLTDAVQRARPEGFVRTFVDAGPALAPLLQEAAQNGVAPEYVGRILAAIGHRPATTLPEMSALPEPLSERELEVLRLLAAGLSNREIAHKLIISLGTAKAHVHNIYGKLDARNRVEVITRARELHLI